MLSTIDQVWQDAQAAHEADRQKGGDMSHQPPASLAVLSRTTRKRCGLSQKRFAAELGVASSTLACLEARQPKFSEHGLLDIESKIRDFVHRRLQGVAAFGVDAGTPCVLSESYVLPPVDQQAVGRAEEAPGGQIHAEETIHADGGPATIPIVRVDKSILSHGAAPIRGVRLVAVPDTAIVLDLKDCAEILSSLKERAAEDLRTVEHQALWYIRGCLRHEELALHQEAE